MADSIPPEAGSALAPGGRSDEAVQVCCPVPGTLERLAPPAEKTVPRDSQSQRDSDSVHAERSRVVPRTVGAQETAQDTTPEIVQETVQGTAGDER